MKGILEELFAARCTKKVFRKDAEILHCGKCEEDKPSDEFYDGIKGKKDSWCKKCKRQYNREVIANRSRKEKLNVHK